METGIRNNARRIWMRRLTLLVLLAAMTVPAGAATKMTVAQLEQAVATAHGAPDAKLAEQLSGLELTERLSANRLARLRADLPGEKAQQALTVLADAAEFLNLPAAEIPSTAAPDLAAQRQIMSLVVSYTTKSVHELPNFFATRETTRFEDRPQYEGYLPLHFIARYSKSVVYREGQEMIDTASGKSGKSGDAEQGLVSWGEFGPILSTVLLDAAQSKLAWSHWEQGASGPVAVFGYSVPDTKSHYWVQFCCVGGKTGGIPMVSHDGSQGIESAGEAPHTSRERAGYHGEITVDPATGAILRITANAELPLSTTLTRAAVMVEYGSVEIGGKSFICPKRSVALSLIRYAHATTGAHSILDHDPLKTFVNDVAFEQYHRLGAETRILGEGGEDFAQSSTGAGVQPDLTNFQPASAAMTAPPAPAPTVAPAAPAEAAPSPAPTPAPVSAPQQVAPQEQILTLKANARAVEVDVVVTDKKQAPVTGLGRQLFEVLEDGKPQAVDYFEEHTAKPAPVSEAPKLTTNLYTNLPATPVVDSVNVVLIDKLNTPLQDQVHVHQQILDFLQKMKPGTRIAIFVMGKKLRLIQGFTSDSAQLQAALNDPKNGDIPEKTDASRSRQDDADDQDQADMHAVMMGGHQGRNGTGYSRSRGSLAAGQASIAGNQAGERVSMTLTGLEFLARYLAGIQGRKNLIWFSRSFPVAVFPSPRELKGSLGSQRFDPGAKEASNLLALSDVAVYPVNAEGIQMDNATEASGYDQKSIGTLYQQSDRRSIATEAVNKLANDTGGKAFTNTNDLAGALTHAIDDGAHYYTLSYTPANSKMDGGYRRIEVRLNQGSYDLAYRRGYFADDYAAPEPQADSNPLQPLLVRGAPASTQIVFSVRLLLSDSQPAQGDNVAGGNTKLTLPLTRYRANFNLRPEDVKLDVSPDGRRTGKIQVSLLAYDSNGAALNWAGGTMALNLSAEQFAAMQRTGIPAHLEIDLPSAALYLEAGVYDWTARKAGTLEIPLPSAATQQSGFQARASEPRN
jgi:VWFA-related protein